MREITHPVDVLIFYSDAYQAFTIFKNSRKRVLYRSAKKSESLFQNEQVITESKSEYGH